MLTLITGGARSGKSSFAQSLCGEDRSVTYIATARPEGEEMRERIARHKQDRPQSWITIEEPLSVADAVRQNAGLTELILVDCITVWVSNILFQARDLKSANADRSAHEQISSFVEASRSGRVIAVTNEVGSGIVPESAVARHFRDLQGFVNQQLARAADVVYYVVCGIAMQIKPKQMGERV